MEGPFIFAHHRLERMPDSIWSLIYTANFAAEVPGRAEADVTVSLVSGFRILFEYARFTSKLFWLKLMVLQMLGRDFIIAIAEGEAAAILGVRYDRLSKISLSSDEACIYTVYTKETFRGRGLAKTLLMAVMERLSEKKCTLFLEVGELNERMLAVVDSLKFFKLVGLLPRPIPLPQTRRYWDNL